jgi:glycerol-3-phosphate dehydrogenase (NAD(P)+)
MTQVVSRLPVSILGAGAWGTALAIAACDRANVMLWGRDTKQMRLVARDRVNEHYLPHTPLPSSLEVTDEPQQALAHCTQSKDPGLLIVATPVLGLRPICELIADHMKSHGAAAGVIWTCKGLLPESGELPHEVVHASLKQWPELGVGVLSGPSFAKEVARGLPVALTVASHQPHLRDLVTSVYHSNHMRIYGSSDVLGVEVGAALKNVMAIACGISDGLRLGDNARAALITRGLAEIARFGVALGAQTETFYGLTGLGDLVLTATGDQSRNRQVGLQIGRGLSLNDILAGGLTAEGARCAQAVKQRADALGLDLPITDAVCDTLFNNVEPQDAVARLMARHATAE